MKILLINKFYRPVGGPETIVFDTTRELQALGHEVIPFAMAHPDNLESGYSSYFVSNVDYTSKQTKGAGRLVKEAAGIIYSTEARNNITRLIADVKPDIAHAHNIYHQLSPSILKALKKHHVPTVLTFHDYKLLCANMNFYIRGSICEKCVGRKFHHAVFNKCVKDSYLSSLLCCIEGNLHRLMRIYERNVDLFISPSQFLRDKMVQYGRISSDRIVVLPNYADTRLISPEYQSHNYCLYVGKLEHHKGIPTLLKACQHLPDFEIRLVGRGPLLDEGKRFATDHGLNNIKFLGFQTGENLSQLFCNARFVVVPSEWYENCPMVILEAFAAGTPVIANRLGGMTELINDGVDGYLVNPGDVDELAERMRVLADSTELASEMGRKAREKVEQHYSIGSHINSLIKIYNELRC